MCNMKKARIFVITVPNDCLLCPFSSERHEFGNKIFNCKADHHNTILESKEDYVIEKLPAPSWCPLKEGE